MSENVQPKILLAAPTHELKEYVTDAWLERVAQLTHSFDIYIVDNSYDEGYANRFYEKAVKHGLENRLTMERDAWCSDVHGRLQTSYNKIREFFLKGDYTHLFILEVDVFPPLDVIEKMLALDKDCVVGPYILRIDEPGCYGVHHARLRLENGKILPNWYKKEDLGTEPFKCEDTFAIGCILVKRKVFYDVVFQCHPQRLPDSFFHHSLYAGGYEAWCLPMEIEHRYKEWETGLEAEYDKVGGKYVGKPEERSKVE